MTHIELDDPRCQVRLVRSPRATRFTLRMETAGARAVLTVPPSVPDAETRRFLSRNGGWLWTALGRQAVMLSVGPGAVLPVAGRPVRVETRPGARRPPGLE